MDSKGILKNWIVRNLLLAALFVFVLVLAANILMSVMTKHGQQITVPDLSGLTLNEARYEAGKSGLEVQIGDSVFVRKMRKGVVFSQNPKAGSNVKPGRKITLVTNAMNSKKVTMPSLVGFSMRQAKAELSSKGLMLGRLIYVNDIATNNVLKQLYRNREITPGTSVDSGSSIDLVVGLNSSEAATFIPDVVGMKYMRAVDLIQENSLNISKMQFDESVRNYTDSLAALVYRQTPSSSEASVTMGTGVSIYLTVDESKLSSSKN